MQTLDGFVTRARLQNGIHHEKQLQSLDQLSSTVQESYSSIGTHFGENFERAKQLDLEMKADQTVLRAMLGPLDENIKEPLSQLRSDVATAPIREYMPTGETPQKIRYEYPTVLPRTDSHQHLLAGLQNSSSVSPPAIASPSRSTNAVFTDSISDEVHLDQPTVYNENDLPTTGGLREVDVNIQTNSAENISTVPSTVVETAPQLKRQNTVEVKVPLKAPGKSSIVKLEGRENNTVPVFRRSASRRLRGSPLVQE
jgi:kinesin family protein 11